MGAMGIEGLVGGLVGLGLRIGGGSMRIFVELVAGMLAIIFCPLLLLTRRIIPKPMTKLERAIAYCKACLN